MGLSDLLLRALGASSLATRVCTRAAAAAHPAELTVDPSLDPITTAAIDALWNSLQFPRSGLQATVSVGRHDLAESPVLAAFEARAWAGLVLSSFARETNLLLPSTEFLVVGIGRMADALTAALTRFGSRVRLTADEPVELWDIAVRHSAPSQRINEKVFITGDIDVVLATGLGHPPLTPDAVAPAGRPLLIVNAGALPDRDTAAFHSGAIEGSVRGLLEFAGSRPVFVVPPVDPDALHHSAAGIRAAYAILLATVGAQHADAALAEALQP